MTAAVIPGRSPAHLTSRISAATPGAPEQPDRAEQRSPRSGALDRPATRSYAVAHDHRLTYHPHPTAMPPTTETGGVKHAQFRKLTRKHVSCRRQPTHAPVRAAVRRPLKRRGQHALHLVIVDRARPSRPRRISQTRQAPVTETPPPRAHRRQRHAGLQFTEHIARRDGRLATRHALGSPDTWSPVDARDDKLGAAIRSSLLSVRSPSDDLPSRCNRIPLPSQSPLRLSVRPGPHLPRRSRTRRFPVGD
jgi:hypothetical protein